MGPRVPPVSQRKRGDRLGGNADFEREGRAGRGGKGGRPGRMGGGWRKGWIGPKTAQKERMEF